MNVPSGRRFWVLYVITIGVLSSLSYIVAQWVTSEPPPSVPMWGDKPSVIEEGNVQPSPPVYDTVSPLKQDR